MLYRKIATTAAIGALIISLAACGNNSDKSDKKKSEAQSSSSIGPTGDACAQIPENGAGSLDGMANAPVATAASSNPLLSSLTHAISAAQLGGSLNGAKAITVFAPSNEAFSKLPKGSLESLMADPKGKLTKVLNYHVIGERLSPKQLAGTHKTLNGADVTISGSDQGDSHFTVGPNNANVVCSGIQTANATVYIVDQVLMPPSTGDTMLEPASTKPSASKG